MTDVDGIVEIKVVGQGAEVIGVVVHVMAVAGLGGAPVTAAVVGDDPIAVQ